MDADPFDTVVDYEEPTTNTAPMYRAGYRKTALRKRWLHWGIIIFLLVIGNADETLRTIEIVTAPLIVLYLVLEFWWWRKARFCPECQALTHWPGWKDKLHFCVNCGRLVDPTRTLIDPPGVINLNDERYRKDAEPVVKLIALIVLLCIKDRSREIRLEPSREQFRIRYRCDGILYDMVPPPLHLHRAVSATLRAMVGLPHDRQAQTAGLAIKVDGHTISARLNFEPHEFGENVIVWLSETNAALDAPALLIS